MRTVVENSGTVTLTLPASVGSAGMQTDGEVGVQSQVGRGSTFSATIQLEKQPEAAEPVRSDGEFLSDLRVVERRREARQRQGAGRLRLGRAAHRKQGDRGDDERDGGQSADEGSDVHRPMVAAIAARERDRARSALTSRGGAPPRTAA